MTMRMQGEQGTTLVEVVIATAILATLMAGLMSLAALAISTTENQGHLGARTTEYAQDKMEQLLALTYGDISSDTRTFPAGASGGSGLARGGSSNPATPVALYVDYLDENGNLCGTTGAACAAPVGTTAPTGWFYQRVWQIDDSTSHPAELAANLKRITVSSTIARGFGGAMKAQSTLTVLKASGF
jgi:type II secretory pathway pseudopilin PulG